MNLGGKGRIWKKTYIGALPVTQLCRIELDWKPSSSHSVNCCAYYLFCPLLSFIVGILSFFGKGRGGGLSLLLACCRLIYNTNQLHQFIFVPTFNIDHTMILTTMCTEHLHCLLACKIWPAFVHCMAYSRESQFIRRTRFLSNKHKSEWLGLAISDLENIAE